MAKSIFQTMQESVQNNSSNDEGLLEPGNINLKNRPKVKNDDGSFSTVRSISVNMDGKEVLIPTISDDGKLLSNEDAIRNFKETGKNLGKFKDIDSANNYAEKLHNEQANYYAKKPIFSVPGPADKPIKVSSKELIDSMVAKDELPDNPAVLKALLDGKANINIVKERHASFRSTHPIATIDEAGVANKVQDLKVQAVQDADKMEDAPDAFSGPTAKNYEGFFGKFVGAVKDYGAGVSNELKAAGAEYSQKFRENPIQKLANDALPILAPGVAMLVRPELGKSFLSGASFELYQPNVDDLTAQEKLTAKAFDVGGMLIGGWAVGEAFGALPIVKKLQVAGEAVGESIKSLKAAKTVAKGAGLLDEAASIAPALNKARMTNAFIQTARVGGESFATGAVVGGVKSTMQRNSVKDILVDAVTEGTFFAGLGVALLPVTAAAGKAFSWRQEQRASAVMTSMAKNPEIQALAKPGATPEYLASVKAGIEAKAEQTAKDAMALSAIEKIKATKPLVGLQSALLANPEVLRSSFEDSLAGTSRALFGEGGPYNSLLGQNKSLKLLFDAGKHKDVLDSAQTALTDQIAKNPEAKEHIIAPFAQDTTIMNKVYANRLLKGVKNPDDYPSLQKNLLNYLGDKSEENALLLSQDAPKKFMQRVENKEKYFDPRLNSKEIDGLVGDIFHEAINTLAGGGKTPFSPQSFGKFKAIDDTLTAAITFNKELSRNFIEAYGVNSQAFDDNFVKLDKTGMLGSARDAVYLKNLNAERNITLSTRRQLTSAMQETETALKSATDPKALADLNAQLTVLKDKRRVLNLTFANQNREMRKLTSVLDRLPEADKIQLDEVLARVHVPRRAGQPFGDVLNANLEAGAKAEGIKRQIANAEEQGLSDNITSTLESKLKELRHSKTGYIQNAQRYKGQFGAGDNPYFVREGSELADTMNSFMVTGTDIKEVKKFTFPFGVNLDNPRRQMQREFGHNNVFEKSFDKIKTADSMVNDQVKYFNDEINKIGIRQGSTESALLQKFGEGRLKKTDPEFLALKPEIQKKLIDGNGKMRVMYDGILDKINSVMRSNALPEIPKLDNFYTHFQQTMDSVPQRIKKFLAGEFSDVDENLFDGKNGRMFWKSTFESDPKATMFKSAKHRNGGEFVDDAIGGIQTYIKPAMERIFYTDMVREIDTARHFAPKNIGEFLQSIKSNYLLKEPNYLDQSASSALKKGMMVVRSRLGKGAIPFNPNTAIQQLLSVPQNFALSPMHGMKAVVQMFTKDGAEAVSLSKNLKMRDPFHLAVDKEASMFEHQVFKKLGINKLNEGMLSKMADKGGEYWEAMGGFAMNTFDRVAAKHAYLTGFSQAKAKGLGDLGAARFADRWVEMVQNDMTRISQPEFYQSVIGKSLGQFQSFMTNFSASIMNDLPKIARTEGGARAVSMITKSVAGMAIANETARSIGIPAPFDLDTFIPFMGSYRFGPPGELSIPYQVGEFFMGKATGDKAMAKKGGKALMRTGTAMLFPGASQVSKVGEAVWDRKSPGPVSIFKQSREERIADKEATMEAKHENRMRYKSKEDDKYGGEKAFVRDMLFGKTRNEKEDQKTLNLYKRVDYQAKAAVRLRLTEEKDKRRRLPPLLGRKRDPTFIMFRPERKK